MGIFSENILSFKLFFESETVNSEHELFRTHKELLSKRKYQKNCKQMHEIIKILYTRKIKFRKIWNVHSCTIFSSIIEILAFLNDNFLQFDVRYKWHLKNWHDMSHKNNLMKILWSSCQIFSNCFLLEEIL